MPNNTSLVMSPPASDDLAPAGQETHRFFLAPLRHTKTLYLIRHGEGYHNLFGEKDHEAYKSEQFFDAHLDPKGWLQCAALRAHLERATTHDGAESLLDRIECVVVSPLMRALETAVGSLGGEHVSADGSAAESTDVTIDSVSKQRLMYVGSDSLEGIRPGHPPIAPRSTNHRAPLPFLACELCREHIGLNPCDRRRGTSYYRETFPGVDFSEIETETDELWGTMNETNGDMCQRAHRFMEWIMKRKEQHIAVVTHSAFMVRIGPFPNPGTLFTALL